VATIVTVAALVASFGYPVQSAAQVNQDTDLFLGATAFSTKLHNNTALPPSKVVDGVDTSYALVGGSFQQINMWVDLGTARVINKISINTNLGNNLDLAACTGRDADGHPTGCTIFATVAAPGSNGNAGVVTVDTGITTAMRVWGIWLGGSSYDGDKIFYMKGYGTPNGTPAPTATPPAACPADGGVVDLFKNQSVFTTKRHDPTGLGNGVDGDDSTFANVGGAFQQLDYWVDLGTPQVVKRMSIYTTVPQDAQMSKQMHIAACTGRDTNGVATGCTSFTIVSPPGMAGLPGVVTFDTHVYVPMRIWGIQLAEGGYPYEHIHTISGFGPCSPAAIGTNVQTAEALTANPVEDLCHADCGDPINTTTGNFWRTFEDLSIPGRGAALSFNRTYNSLLASEAGTLGHGWTHSYNMYINQDSAGNYLLHQANGSIAPFGPDLSRPSRVKATLTENYGTYIFSPTETGERYYLKPVDRSGMARLTQIVDRSGLTTTLTYQAGLLRTVTEPAGRTLTLTYTSGLLTSVGDSGNRTVTFAYDVQRDLTSFNDVGGRTTTFTYDDYHRLLTTQDPKGGVVTNVYDNKGRVTRQTSPTNGVFDFGYAQGSTRITDTRGLVQTHSYTNNLLTQVVENQTAPTTQQAVTTYQIAPGTTWVSSITDPNNKVWSYTYDANGNLLTATDPLSHTTTYTYTQLQLQIGNSITVLSGVEDASGQVTQLEYNNRGNPTLLTNASNLETQFEYDSSGSQLARIVDPEGVVQCLEYNTYGNLTAVVRNCKPGQAANASQNVRTEYGYDTVGQLAWERSPLGESSRLFYDANGLINKAVLGCALSGTVSTTDCDTFSPAAPHLNRTTQFNYDGLGSVVALTDTLGVVNRFDYNNSSLPTRRVLNSVPAAAADASTNVTTTLEYDQAGRIISMLDALGRRTTVTYNEVSRVITETINYVDGNPATGSNDTDFVVRTEYNKLGLPVTTIENYVDGVWSSLQPDTDVRRVILYDALRRPVASIQNYVDGVSSSGEVDTDRITEYGYDEVGNLTAVKGASGRVHVTEYDILYRPLVEVENCTDGNGQARVTNCATGHGTQNDENIRTAYGYNDRGELETYFDGLGRLTRLHRDALGRVTEYVANEGGTVAPANVKTRYSYDFSAVGLTAVITDAENGVQTYKFNRAAWLTSQIDATNREMSFAYDGLGRRVSWTDPLTHESRMFYDALNRPVKAVTNWQNGVVDQGDGPDQDLIATVIYDAVGRRVAQIATGGTRTNYSYDALDRLSSVVDNANGASAPANVTTNYGYDRRGLLTSVTDPLQHTKGFSYNASGWLVKETDGLNRATTYSYDKAGRVSTISDPRPATVTYSYDDLDRLLTITAPNLPATTWQYDAAGRRSSMQDATGTATYTYDGIDNLLQTAHSTNGTVSYGYDLMGRRTSLTHTGALGVLPPDTAATQTVQAAATQTAHSGATQTAQAAGTQTAQAGATQTAQAGATQTTQAQSAATQTAQSAQTSAAQTTVASASILYLHYTNQSQINGGYAMNTGTPPSGTKSITYSDPPWYSNTYASGHFLQGSYTLKVQVNTCSYQAAYVYYELFYTNEDGSGQVAIGSMNQRTYYGYGSCGYIVDTITFASNYGPLSLTNKRLKLRITGSYQYATTSMKFGTNTYLDTPDFVPTGSTNTPTPTNTATAANTSTSTPTATNTATSTSTAIPTGTRPANGGASAPYITYQYDAAGRLKSVKRATSQGQTQSLVAQATYDAAGRLQTIERANGTNTTYSYDGANRLTGQLTQRVSNGATLSNFVYTLNRAGRASSVSEVLGQTTRNVNYTYDGLSRLTAAQEQPGTTYGYSYDLAGNRTQVTKNGTTTENRTYDAADQVIGWQYDAAGNQLSDGTSTYAYDALKRLTSVTANNSTTQYGYNGDDVLARETSGGAQKHYILDVAGGLSEHFGSTTGASTDWHVRGWGREIALDLGGTNGISDWYVSDRLGSVRAMLGNTGDLGSTYNYDPFGGLESTTRPWDYGFTGEQHEAATGLVQLRARWYSTASGRFLTKDPYPGTLRRPMSLNAYLYSFDDPVNYTDPSGRCPWCIIGGALLGAVIGGGAEYVGQVWQNVSENGMSPEAFTSDVDWGSVGRGALSGGVAGAIGGATFGLGTAVLGGGALAGAGVGAASGIIGGQVQRATENVLEGREITDGLFDPAQMALDAGLGGVLGPVAPKVANYVGSKLRGPINQFKNAFGAKVETPEVCKVQLGGVAHVSREQALRDVREEIAQEGAYLWMDDQAIDYLDDAARRQNTEVNAATLGDVIAVRPEYADNVRTLREELIHVRQQHQPDFDPANRPYYEKLAREEMIRNRYAWGLTEEEVQQLYKDIGIIEETGRY
jgi:RHS repeat-associated protein